MFAHASAMWLRKATRPLYCTMTNSTGMKKTTPRMIRASISGSGKEVVRHQPPQLHEPLQVRLDALWRQGGTKTNRQRHAFNFDVQIIIGEQVFDHARMANIIGELFVFGTHAKLARELVGLKIDVVVAEGLGDFGKNAF